MNGHRSSVNPEDVIGTLTKRLRERMSDYYRDRNLENNNLQMVRYRKAAYSRIYMFRAQSEDRQKIVRLAVKVYNGSDRLSFARRQYDTLSSLWPAFSISQTYSIPRPLDFFSDIPALVMEAARGRTVQALLRPFVWQFWISGQGLSACRECGMWLRYFHEATRIAPGCLDAEDKCRKLNSALIQLQGLGISNNVCGRLRSKIGALGRLLSTQEEERALVHGDFTADNVLYDGNKTTALDVEGRYQNLIYHDLASFLNSITLVGLRVPIAESVIRGYSDAFLAGYFGDRKHSSSTLWFLRVSGLAWVALEVLGRYAHQPLMRIGLRRSFIRMFNDLLDRAPI